MPQHEEPTICVACYQAELDPDDQDHRYACRVVAGHVELNWDAPGAGLSGFLVDDDSAGRRTSALRARGAQTPNSNQAAPADEATPASGEEGDGGGYDDDDGGGYDDGDGDGGYDDGDGGGSYPRAAQQARAIAAKAVSGRSELELCLGTAVVVLASAGIFAVVAALVQSFSAH